MRQLSVFHEHTQLFHIETAECVEKHTLSAEIKCVVFHIRLGLCLLSKESIRCRLTLTDRVLFPLIRVSVFEKYV